MAYNFSQAQIDWLKAQNIDPANPAPNGFNLKLPDGTIVPSKINPGQAATLVMPTHTPGELYKVATDYLQSQGAVMKNRNEVPSLYPSGPTNVWVFPDGKIMEVGKDFYENLATQQLQEQGKTVIQSGVLDRSTTEGANIAAGFTGQNVVDPKIALANALKETPLVQQGTTQQGSNSASTGGSAGGLPTISQNLMPGSQGDDVKSLQLWLQQNKFFPPNQEATGYYGDITKKAVADWQKSVGIPVTSADAGYFGPQSRTMLTNLSSGVTGTTGTSGTAGGSTGSVGETSTETNTGGNTSTTGSAGGAGTGGTTGESITGDTTMDSFLKVMKDYLGQNTVDPAINVSDPAVVANFLELATKELHPYYAQKLGEIMPDLNRSLGLLKTQFDTNLKNQEQVFQENLANQRESAAGAGTVFSGARGLGEQNTISAQQRSLDLLKQTAENTAGNALRTAESQLGSSGMTGFNLPDFGGARVSGAGARGGFNIGVGGQYYTPGQYKYGSLPLEEKTAIENLVNTRIKAQQTKNISDRTFSGLSNLT